MAYFPFLIDIKDKLFVVAGGGNVALRKIRKILEFEAKITVISPEIIDEIKSINGITIIQKEIEKEDIKQAFCVIAATNNKDINQKINSWCKEFNIMINAVDDIQNCSFIFPAIIKEDNITVSISSNGAVPELSASIKRRIKDVIPKNISDLSEELLSLRNNLKRNIEQQSQRADIMRKVIQFSENKDYNLTQDELKSFIENMGLKV